MKVILALLLPRVCRATSRRTGKYDYRIPLADRDVKTVFENLLSSTVRLTWVTHYDRTDYYYLHRAHPTLGVPVSVKDSDSAAWLPGALNRPDQRLQVSGRRRHRARQIHSRHRRSCSDSVRRPTR